MKKLTKAAIAAGAGAVLLIGGGTTLAFWTDTQAGGPVTIASGDLDLGTIADGTGWNLQQNASDIPLAEATGEAYVDQLLVPGDVLTKTVQVPVTLTGANNKAVLNVDAAFTGATNALSDALDIEIISINGVANTGEAATVTLTPGATATVNVPVQVAVTFPWDSTNATKALTTTFQAQYTLTQVPVATP